MPAKANVEQFPAVLRQAIVDLCGTRHDDHVCYEEEVECAAFDALMKAIEEYGEQQYSDGADSMVNEYED